MRLCVISNSHIAALKLGWDGILDSHPDVDIDFFGSPKQTMKCLELEGRCLISPDPYVAQMFRSTSGGHEAIKIDQYDGFVVAAAGLSIHWLVHLYAGYRSDDHCRTGQYLVSQDVFNVAAVGMLTDTAAVRIWKMLLSLGVPGVTLFPNPLPGEGLARMPDRAAWLELRENGDAPKLVNLFDAYLARLADDGAQICRQRPSTLSGLLFTRREYSADVSDDNADEVHKNAAFGIMAMTDLIAMAQSGL